MILMRRIAVCLVAASCLLGLSATSGMAAPAPIFRPTTVVVKYNQVTQTYTATPNALELAIGDTFNVENRLLGSGDEFYVAVVNGTGSVRMGSTVCDTIASCMIADDSPNNPAKRFVAVSAGTVRIIRFDGLATQPVTRVGGVKIIDPRAQKSITITGDRSTSDHAGPFIRISGDAVGFPTGTRVRVHVKFPGGEYSLLPGTTPVVDATGKFTWRRTTGKKTYVYVTSLNGEVKSDRVIIPAAD